MRFCLTPVRIIVIKKPKITDAEKNMEKTAFSYTFGGDVN
jgi:hypothetical protein